MCQRGQGLKGIVAYWQHFSDQGLHSAWNIDLES
jgi:hypothetical protein